MALPLNLLLSLPMRRLVAPLFFFVLLAYGIGCTHADPHEPDRLPADRGAPSSTPGTSAGTTSEQPTGQPSPGGEAGGTATGTTNG
jgi:hypothetical protein